MLAKILLLYVYMILACRCLPVVDNQPPAEGQAGEGPNPHQQQGQASIFAADPLLSNPKGVDTLPKSTVGKQSQTPGLQTSSAVTDAKGQMSTSTQTPPSIVTQGQPETSTTSEQSQSKPIVSTSLEINSLQSQLDAQLPVRTQSNSATTGIKSPKRQVQASSSGSLVTGSQGEGAATALKSQQNANHSSSGVDQGRTTPGDTTGAGGNVPQNQLDMPATGNVQPDPTITQVQNKAANATATTGVNANQAQGQIKVTAASQTSTSTGSSRGSTTTMEPLEVEAPEAEPPFDPTEVEPPDHGQLPNQGASSSATARGGHSVQQGAQVESNEIEPADLGTAQAPETGNARGTGSWENPSAWLPGGGAYDPPEPTDAPYFIY